jgi:hypothetical protein
MSGNRDVDAGVVVGEGRVPFDGASRPEPQAVVSMSEAASAIHPRIPPKHTEDSPTVVFVARGPADAPARDPGWLPQRSRRDTP